VIAGFEYVNTRETTNRGKGEMVGSSSKTARRDVKETRERVKGLVLFSKVKKKKTKNRAYE